MGGVEAAHYMINMPLQGDIVPRSPQTQLRLYSGVPWDNSYQHVRLYNNHNDLLSHLEQWRVVPSAQLDNLTPIRVGDYEVRVPFTEMSALNINYVAFLNAGLTSEWVFCFVTDVKWRSENTTILSLELDVFQNNFYNVNVKPCFIEYQHIPRSEDTYGGNLIPVDLESGDNYCARTQFQAYPPENICMYVTESLDDIGNVKGSIVNNVYRAAELIHNTVASNINTTIGEYTRAGKEDAIVALFMAPDICLNAETNPGSEEDNIDVSAFDATLFEGYVPKNKKVYSYPWLYLLVDNNEGTCNRYNFEYSDDGDMTLRFSAIGCLCTSPQIMLVPRNYNGYFTAYQDTMSMTQFPQCAFNSDVYLAWQAQNKNTIALQRENANIGVVKGAIQAGTGLINTVAGGVAMYKTGGLMGGDAMSSGTSQMNAGAQQIYNSLYTIRSLDAMQRDKAVIPPNVHGKVVTENINAARNLNSFEFYTMCCRREFAKVADDYFEMFGYPINEIQTPRLNTRTSWNYIKTQGCGFTGRVDLSQLTLLRNIFDNGVTLWHTDDVGNYGLDND